MQQKICKICKSYNTKQFDELYDDRYGYPKKFEIYECLSCSHKFVDHKLKNEDLINLYSNFYPRSNFNTEDYKPAKYENNFQSWFNGEKSSAYTYVPESVRVLDIGCGFGQSLGYHKNRGCEVYGVEADSNAQRIAEKYDFNIYEGLFDSSHYENNFFDFVTLDQVLEHSVNLIDLLTEISKVLKQNGKLVVSVPNANGWGSKIFGNKWINWHIPYHLQHFSKKSLIYAIETTKSYNISSISTITPSDWLFFQMNHLISFPVVGNKSSYWSKDVKDINKISIAKKIFLKIVNLSYRLKIYHIVTRIFDRLGKGDNIIIILEKK
jgi:SAM-dependent methyltransferase